MLEEEAQERRGLFGRLRRNLGKARGAVTDALKAAVYVGVDRRLYEQTEEMLIAADVGVDGTIKIVDELEQRCTAKKIETQEPFQDELADVVAELLRPDDPERQRIDVSHDPTVILMVGVNGTGKTTTIGKIAWRLKEMGKTPLMVAGDTFRAAAVEQLNQWAERVGCEIIKQGPDADPAAVVFDGVAAARSRGADVVLVDTAGRLHTQVNLMRELEKVRRVIEKQLPGAPHETLLVLDATTGQNGLRQAQEFKQAVDVSGVVLTKLDGTAKGGIVVAIHEIAGHPDQAHRRRRTARGPAALRAGHLRARHLRLRGGLRVSRRHRRVSLPLETERLVIREFMDDDAPELARAFADPEVLWWLTERFTVDAARAWVARARDGYGRSGMGLYAVCLRDGERLIGDCGLVVQTVESHALVEIGWHLERDAWGRGYATEAARAVLTLAGGARRAPRALPHRPGQRALPAGGREAGDERRAPGRARRHAARPLGARPRRCGCPVTLPLQTPRLEIRDYTPEDADDVARVLGDPRVGLREGQGPMTRAEALDLARGRDRVPASRRHREVRRGAARDRGGGGRLRPGAPRAPRRG